MSLLLKAENLVTAYFLSKDKVPNLILTIQKTKIDLTLKTLSTREKKLLSSPPPIHSLAQALHIS